MSSRNTRVLIVDDRDAIHTDFSRYIRKSVVRGEIQLMTLSLVERWNFEREAFQTPRETQVSQEETKHDENR